MYAAACATGLQNAMASAYSGAVVRTTHVSGMFTDLGIYLGHALRGLPINMKRLQLSFLVISGFLCGGIFGTLAGRATAGLVQANASSVGFSATLLIRTVGNSQTVTMRSPGSEISEVSITLMRGK
jgi:uncharacterized membrane protein YoaK (UPF0700 family)